MSRIKLEFLAIFGFFLLIASCQKQQPCTHCPITSDITPNNAPTINFPSDGYGYFVVSTVTTMQNFNEQIDCQYPQIINVSNVSGQTITIGMAGANFPTYSAYFQGHLMYGTDCCYCLNLFGPADTITLIPPTVWAYQKTSVTLTDTSYNDTTSPPIVPSIVSADTISTRSSFTFHVSGLISGDSIIYFIKGSQNKIQKVLSPGTDSCVFTASDMASIGLISGNINTGEKAGLIQVATYKIHSSILDGNYKCYFVKEACSSKYVVFN